MARLSASLSLLLLASSGLVAAYRPALRTRNLQAADNSTTAAANTTAAADSTTATTTNSTTTANSTKADLPACRDSFPPGKPLKFVKAGGADAPTDPNSFFENSKAEPFLKHEVAKLATCLIDQNACQDSVNKVDVLTGALASVTQQLFSAGLAHPTDNTTAVKQNAVSVSPSTAPADNSTTTTPTANSTTTFANTTTPAANTTTAAPTANSTTTTTTPAANSTTATPHANATMPHPDNSTTKPAVHDNSTATHPNATTTTATPADNTTTATSAANSTTTTTRADPAAIASSLATAPQLKGVLDEHASCVASQPGGQDAFLHHYASFIRDVIHGNATSSSTNTTTSSTTANTTAPAK